MEPTSSAYQLSHFKVSLILLWAEKSQDSVRKSQLLRRKKLRSGDPSDVVVPLLVYRLMGPLGQTGLGNSIMTKVWLYLRWDASPLEGKWTAGPSRGSGTVVYCAAPVPETSLPRDSYERPMEVCVEDGVNDGI